MIDKHNLFFQFSTTFILLNRMVKILFQKTTYYVSGKKEKIMQIWYDKSDEGE